MCCSSRRRRIHTPAINAGTCGDPNHRRISQDSLTDGANHEIKRRAMESVQPPRYEDVVAPNQTAVPLEPEQPGLELVTPQQEGTRMWAPDSAHIDPPSHSSSSSSSSDVKSLNGLSELVDNLRAMHVSGSDVGVTVLDRKQIRRLAKEKYKAEKRARKATYKEEKAAAKAVRKLEKRARCGDCC